MSLNDALIELLGSWRDLPRLVGPDWPDLGERLTELLWRLERAPDDDARARLASELLLAFRPYPAVRDRLQALLAPDLERTRQSQLGSGAGPPDWDRVIEMSRAVLSDAAPPPPPVPPMEPGQPEPPRWESVGPSRSAGGEEGAELRQAPTDRHIGAWIQERQDGDTRDKPLRVGEAYTLCFEIGRARAASLIDGPDTEVPDADVPEAGLDTEWVVLSRSVELSPLASDPSVRVLGVDDPPAWTARFSLSVTRQHSSEIRRLRILPRPGATHELQVILYVANEVYRQFTIRLTVEQPGTATLGPVKIRGDVLHAPIDHLNLRPTQEWTTPPGELSITVLGDQAWAKGDVGLDYVDQPTGWYGAQAAAAGPITNVRASAEQFRARWEQYLNDVDPDDLVARLGRLRQSMLDRGWAELDGDWAALTDRADPAHHQRWAEVAASGELRDLAVDGHALYETYFPHGSDLRGWLDRLRPGHRVDISWLQSSSGWMPHVPWGLMYLPDVPAPGAPLDPMGFLALRFRLSYFAHAVQERSKALGGPDHAHRAYLLYWGSRADDPTGVEARWQREQWSAWGNQVFVPVPPSDANAKQAVLELLYDPQPTPTTVLYLFCQASVGEGNNPVLRFGDTIQPLDVIKRTEMGGNPLADRPLVFANACTTSSGDPYVANELEASFFRRGCRAYVGTETKVPIQLASRFAAIFFHFFYRQISPRPIAAGEALAQARLLLWTAYNNIGGIFYTYVNQYELFMATDDEVSALRGG